MSNSKNCASDCGTFMANDDCADVADNEPPTIEEYVRWPLATMIEATAMR